MKKKKIYFITDYTFDNRDFFRYQIPLLAKEFKIKIISISDFVYPNLKLKKKTFNRKVKFFSNLQFFEHMQKNFENIIVVDLMTVTFKTQYIRFLLKMNNIKYVKIYMTQFPSPNDLKRNIIQKIYFKLFIFKGKEKVFLLIKNKIVYFFNFYLKPDLVISGGEYLNKYFIKKNINNVNFISYDYHLAKGKKKNLIKKNYVVFVDSGILGNRDYELYKVTNFKNKESYEKKLNLFFKNIEKTYDLKVVIAAHPKSDKNVIKKAFKDYKIEFNKTVDLIKYSKFIMIHTSTAISSAIIFKKPVFLLSMDEFNNSWILKEIEYFSKILKLKIIDIDHHRNFSKLKFNFDKMSYANYENNYLKSSYVKYSNFGNKILKTFCEL